MGDSFGVRLRERVRALGPLCVGVDPSAEVLSSWERPSIAPRRSVSGSLGLSAASSISATANSALPAKRHHQILGQPLGVVTQAGPAAVHMDRSEVLITCHSHLSRAMPTDAMARPQRSASGRSSLNEAASSICNRRD